MSAFTVEFDNEPGRLAAVCEAMAERGVNLVLAGAGHGASGTVMFIADDESAARAVLDDAGIAYDDREALTVRLRNVPGSGAVMFRKLANADINVEMFLPLRVSDTSFVATLCVSDLDAARRVLGDLVVSA